MSEHPRERPAIHPIERISRRKSLFTIAVLALLGTSVSPAAAKNVKRRKRKSKRKSNQNAEEICQAQVVECQEMLFVLCQDRDDPAACEAPSLPCCQPLATCDATAMLDCFFAIATALTR